MCLADMPLLLPVVLVLLLLVLLLLALLLLVLFCSERTACLADMLHALGAIMMQPAAAIVHAMAHPPLSQIEQDCLHNCWGL
jgi:hypothetical protein